jgi:predicted transporter
MGKVLLIGSLGLILSGAVIWAVWLWSSMPGADLGVHGTTALVLGVVFSLIVGCGLMALVFYSARRGYDDQVRYEDDED